MTRFFATFNDMKDGLERIEKDHSVKYVHEGMYMNDPYPIYNSFQEIPNLGSTNTSRSGTPTYLVFPRDADIVVKKITLDEASIDCGAGSIVKAENNSLSFLFRPGGWYIGDKYQKKMLMGGDIGIYGERLPAIERLCKDFRRKLTKGFTTVSRPVDSYEWKVGQEAYDALLNNIRLVTEEAYFSLQWDLSISSQTKRESI